MGRFPSEAEVRIAKYHQLAPPASQGSGVFFALALSRDCVAKNISAKVGWFAS